MPGRFPWNFRWLIFKPVFVIDNWGLFCDIALGWMSQDPLLMISQHWFRLWLGAVRQQAITWANVDPDLCRHMVLLGQDELRNHQNTFISHFTPWHWNVADCQNELQRKTKISTLYSDNIMAADDLATQGARASVAMVLPKLSWNILLSAPQGLTHWPWVLWWSFKKNYFKCLVAIGNKTRGTLLLKYIELCSSWGS